MQEGYGFHCSCDRCIFEEAPWKLFGVGGRWKLRNAWQCDLKVLSIGWHGHGSVFCRSEKGFCALHILRSTVAWEDGKSYLLNGLSRELLVLSFHLRYLRVLCTCLVLQFLCFCHGPYPFCTCRHPTQTLPDLHQITVPYQSVWRWLVYGFSLDTVHTCGYIDWEYPKRLLHPIHNEHPIAAASTAWSTS